METRLVDVAREMGLTFEASGTGRWIRIHSLEGTAYVSEEAWGGYCAFSDGQDEHKPELYFDPATAIPAALASGADAVLVR